jgi:hypothetical protein
VANNDVPLVGEFLASSKMVKTKFRFIFKRFLDEMFEVAITAESRLTPDAAMRELDDVLESVLEAMDKTKTATVRPSRPLRIDVVAARQKIHHYAVDLFYRTYFPRKAGMEGQPRRGATGLPLEYLDQVLKLSREGKNPAQIATLLGQVGPGAAGRISKQIRLAEKRWAEMLANIRRLGAIQQARLRAKVPVESQSRGKRCPRRKPRTEPGPSSPK